MTSFIILSIFAYLFGSISFGFIIAKIRGVDLRTIGSKSTSTTNVSRALGWRWGIVSAVLEFSKGVIPTLLALRYLTNEWQIITVCLLPVIGHIFPVWLNFKGGRGAAPYYGAIAILVGFKFFLILLPVFFLILYITRIMSLTNILFPWMVSIFFLILFPLPYFVYGVVGAILITFALRENIKRLRQGTEPRVAFKW